MQEEKLEQQMDLESNDFMEDDSDFEGFVEEVDEENQKQFPNKYAKLLHQRNEAKKKAFEYKEKLEKYGEINPEKLDEIISQNKKMTEYKLKTQFLSNFPDAQKYMTKIEDYILQNPGISYQNAYKIIKFEEINDKSYQNKLNSSRTCLVGNTPKRIRQFDSFKNMDTNKQFEYLKKEFKSGKIII